MRTKKKVTFMPSQAESAGYQIITVNDISFYNIAKLKLRPSKIRLK